MGAVSVEETASVSSPLLDDFLRGHWALRDGLRGNCIHDRLAVGIESRLTIRINALNLLWFDQVHGVIWLEVLDDALRDEQQRADDAKWQEYPEATANEIYPEVAERLHLAAGDAADKCDGQHDSGGRRNEVVKGEACHLREIAHRRLA